MTDTIAIPEDAGWRRWLRTLLALIAEISRRLVEGVRFWRRSRIAQFVVRQWHRLAPLLVEVQRRFANEVNAVPYTTARDARETASIRQEGVAAALQGDDEVLVEVPPELSGWSPPARRDLRETATHAISLRWQLGDERLLLLARASDAVEVLIENEARANDTPVEWMLDRTQPVVTVQPLWRLLRRARPELYPWRIVILTTDPAFFRERMQKLAKWLGIGVDIAKSGPVRPQASCSQGGGRTGTVSGAVRRSDGRVYGVTCAHVLGASCSCAAWAANSDAAAAAADAALVSNGGCFGIPVEEGPSFEPADDGDSDRLIANETPVMRLGGGGGNRNGVVYAPTDRFSNGGRLCHFPSFIIRPRTWRYGFVPWPLVQRAFSRDGDSGSWVVEPSSSRWVGMVVCGVGGHTIAHQAHALVDYFDTCLRSLAGDDATTTDFIGAPR